MKKILASAFVALALLGSPAFVPPVDAGGITTTFTQCRTLTGDLWPRECRINTIDWGGPGETPTVTHGQWFKTGIIY